jgi:hypothetical protein
MHLRFSRFGLVVMLGVGAAACAWAQTRGVVHNAQGAPVGSATIMDMAGNRLAVSAPDGSFTLAQAPDQIEVTAAHYVTAVVTILPGQAVSVVLRQPLETVTVTAYRSALGSSDSPAGSR